MRRRTRFCELCQKPSNVRFCSYECRDTDRSNTAIKRSELGIQKASATVYRSYLIRTKGAKCMKCGWSEINPKSGKVPIQLNHINGNSEDHFPEFWLTTNCQLCITETWHTKTSTLSQVLIGS